MQNLPYWLDKDFICPVKIATYKMFEELFKDLPFIFIVTFYGWMVDMCAVFLMWMSLPEVEAQTIINALGISLGVVRFIPALIAAGKAWRDRKKPEQGKK
jgi:hypothetical protein